MFLIIGVVFLVLLSVTLLMLWGHEKIAIKKVTPHAKIKEYWNESERRSHARFNKDLEVEYGVEKKPRLKTSKALNISKGGMKLLLDEKLSKGTILNLKMSLPEKKQAVEIEAEVVWTKDTDEKDLSGKRFFHSGLKFIAVKESSGAHFLQYMTQLESDG